jgi:hypothetical protein
VGQVPPDPVDWGDRIIINQKNDLAVGSVETCVLRRDDSGLPLMDYLEPEGRGFSELCGQ